jgi:hypothetical protein
MDLGLRALTSDQKLELLKQLCEVLVEEDPIIRNLAQQTITTAAERRVTMIAMGKKAVDAVCGAYIESIRQETFQAVQAGFADGSIKLLNSTQEARIVVEATYEAKIAKAEELIRTIEEGKHPPAKAKRTTTTAPPPPDVDDEWERVHVRGDLDPLEIERKKQEAQMRFMQQMTAQVQQDMDIFNKMGVTPDMFRAAREARVRTEEAIAKAKALEDELREQAYTFKVPKMWPWSK